MTREYGKIVGKLYVNPWCVCWTPGWRNGGRAAAGAAQTAQTPGGSQAPAQNWLWARKLSQLNLF